MTHDIELQEAFDYITKTIRRHGDHELVTRMNVEERFHNSIDPATICVDMEIIVMPRKKAPHPTSGKKEIEL